MRRAHQSGRTSFGSHDAVRFSSNRSIRQVGPVDGASSAPGGPVESADGRRPFGCGETGIAMSNTSMNPMGIVPALPGVGAGARHCGIRSDKPDWELTLMDAQGLTENKLTLVIRELL